MLLLQGLSQFRDSGLRRLLLFRGFIDCLLRLRGLGLDLAARSRKLAREGRGTRLCLFECAALLLGARCHPLRGFGFLHQSGGLLLLLLQGFSQFRDSGLRRLLLLHGLIDCLLRLCGAGLDFALCSCQFARQRLKRLTMLIRACGQLLSCGASRQRESVRLFALLFDRLPALRSFSLLELRCFVTGLSQLRRLLEFPLGRCQFTRQRGAARAFLLKCLTLLLRARGQLLWPGGGLPRGDGYSLLILFDRLRGIRNLRL